MNWGNWFYGALVALISAGLTGLVAWGTLPNDTSTKQIVVVCLIPGLTNFVSWLKTTPPPAWNGVDRRGLPSATPKERIP